MPYIHINQPWVYMCSPSRSVSLPELKFQSYFLSFLPTLTKVIFRKFKPYSYSFSPGKENPSLVPKMWAGGGGGLVTKSCPTLRPHGCSLLGSSVHVILQARIQEWVAISFSRGSSWPRDWTWVSCIAGRFFTIWATREAHPFWRQQAKRSWASQVALVVKKPPASAANARDAGSIPGSGRSPGGGHGNPLQYSC